LSTKYKLSGSQRAASQDAYYFPYQRYILNTYVFLNGFDENMETSSMPTNCNVDSSAMPRNIQDLMRESEIEVDRGIPLFFFKE
jgi:hypothetical protein